MWRRSGRAGAVEVRGLVRAEEFTGRDEQRRSGAGQHVGGFACGVARVERYDHAARIVGGQACHDPVPRVRRPDRDAVPGSDAMVDHRGGGDPHLVAQLGEGEPSHVGDQGVMVGELAGDPVEDLRNGPQL